MTDLILHLLTMVMITTLVLSAQQVLLFRCGILALSTAGFFALGAYFSTWLTVEYSVPVIVSIFVSPSICLVLAILIGIPIFRQLKGDFLALATLMLAQLTTSILKVGGIGGSAGFAGIPPLPLLSTIERDALAAVFTVGILFLMGLLALRVVWKSRLALLADVARADPSHLQVIGHDPVAISTQFFAISAAFAGFGGSLQAHYLGAIEPSMSSIQSTVIILTGGIIAGKRSYLGSILGAIVVVCAPEILQSTPLFSGADSWKSFPLARIGFAALVIALAFLFFKAPRRKVSA